jgi:16S rRNA (guanine527-N7)-methyltransferase
MEFKEILAEKGPEAGLSFTDLQLEQFNIYYKLLVETNKQLNLTALTSPEDVAVKHIIDSLLAFEDKFFTGRSLIDVGSGAGFPGIPLKIYCPSLKVVLLDSLAKRLKFLETVIAELKLQEISCVHMRAEDAGQNKLYRGQFDLVTARAVAKLAVLAELCLPLVKVGGFFIALKGSKYQTELEESARSLKVLGGELVQAEPVTLPGLDDGRAIIRIKKIKPTPEAYPRKAGLPAKKPIL